MIHVIATVELVEGKREAFLAEFRKIVPLVRAEAGCVEYGPTCDARTDIAAQIPVREHVINILEKWSDVAALKAHLVAPHMVEYRPRVKDLVRKVTLQILEPV
jgi:quinol monooxygenase YgiN